MTSNADIYRKFESATSGVAVHVIMEDGDLIGRVIFKYARSGLRTTCYFHVYGLRMTTGYASGGGYDKATAAAHVAVNKSVLEDGAQDPEALKRLDWFRVAIKDQGRHWNNDLEAAGFIVRQIV